jgi:hypothetical protein
MNVLTAISPGLKVLFERVGKPEIVNRPDLFRSGGAGAVSRFNMGLVIASGLSIGTLFTLFVVPAVYMLIAADHSKRPGLDELAEPAST